MFEIVFHPLYNELRELIEPKPVFETYETPLRTRVIWEYFRSRGYIPSDFDKQGLINNLDIDLRVKKPSPLKKKDILRIHSPYLVELVENLSDVGYGEIGNLVQATCDTLDIALLSAGGAYIAIKDVFESKCNQSFALIRPPGHHAIRDESDGLCVFNNIAVSIAKLREECNFKGKIACIDIDCHLGDGLQKIYYEDPSVLYSSIHEYIPGESGMISEVGAGDGKGFNICYPVPLEADDAYFEGYCRFLEPYLEKYKPDLIIVALGLDGHWADPIGNLSFTSKGYAFFAKWVHSMANKVSNGKVSLIFEGGYNLAVLPHLAEIFLCEFTKKTKYSPFEDYMFPYLNEQKTENSEIKKHNQNLKDELDPYWE
ncbi:MAG: histone deacetylase [Promethearchaeota archaeon]|nr:MAG: histone deacetylase [Candidatus Lokiarchaeota archaeon]